MINDRQKINDKNKATILKTEILPKNTTYGKFKHILLIKNLYKS